jgi:type I restriction enzyme, S subunit
VPAHWEVTPLKHFVSLRSGCTPSKENRAYWDGDVPWASSKDLKQAELTDTEDHITRLALEDGAAELVPVGSLLVVVRGMILIHSFPVTKALVPMAINQDLKALRPDTRVTEEFLAWLLRGSITETMRRVDEAAHGTKVLRLDAWTSMKLPIPPVSDQEAIAEFLGRETAKIDALVAEQQRQAVISHAVTKGLNPDAPMKPSGVEWLGDVPAHWQVKRLKHISPFMTVGVVVNPSTFVAEEGLPFIYGGDIREGVIDWVNARRIDVVASAQNAKTRLAAGDLLTVRVGAPGVTAVVPPECDGGNCASVMLIRQGQFSSDWLCFTMNTRVVRFQVEVVQYGAAQEQFNISHAVNFWVPVPPTPEQDAIAGYLKQATFGLDTLTAEAERAITLLQERRTALISAAVTGQIDVRHIDRESVA